MSYNPTEDALIKQVDQKAEDAKIAQWEKQLGAKVHSMRHAPIWWVVGAGAVLFVAWLATRGDANALSDIDMLLRPLRGSR